MRKAFFVLPTLFFIFLADPAGVLAGSGPKIVIDEKIFDFKEMIEGQRVEHVFKVVNQGDQPLELQKIKTS
jgi:Protein of unknown function (DUF1573)